MPPLPQYPNQPTGSPDIRPYPYGGGGYDASAGYAGQYGQPGYGQGQGYGYGQGVDYVTPEQWAAAIQQAKDFLKYQAGGATPFEREQAYAKWQDAEKGYRNSLKIAQLQADTSRYGYDQQRQSQIDQLKQNDRQFAANHQLDVRKADISEAQLIAEQRSQPNRLFQTMDLEQALGSIRAGNHATTMAMPTGVAAFDGLSTDYRGNPYLAGGAGGSGATGVAHGRVRSHGHGPTDQGGPIRDGRPAAVGHRGAGPDRRGGAQRRVQPVPRPAQAGDARVPLADPAGGPPERRRPRPAVHRKELRRLRAGLQARVARPGFGEGGVTCDGPS
jgi:hypothetical protein